MKEIQGDIEFFRDLLRRLCPLQSGPLSSLLRLLRRSARQFGKVGFAKPESLSHLAFTSWSIARRSGRPFSIEPFRSSETSATFGRDTCLNRANSSPTALASVYAFANPWEDEPSPNHGIFAAVEDWTVQSMSCLTRGNFLCIRDD